MQRAVPAGGDEDLVFGRVDDAAHGLAVFTYSSLLASCEIDSIAHTIDQKLLGRAARGFAGVRVLPTLSPFGQAQL